MRKPIKENIPWKFLTNSGGKLLRQVPIILLASSFLYHNPSLAKPANPLDADQGVWLFTTDYNYDDYHNHGEERMTCKNNQDGGFVIHELYRRAETLNSYDYTLHDKYRMERKSDNGVDYDITERSIYASPIDARVKEKLPESCAEYAERIRRSFVNFHKGFIYAHIATYIISDYYDENKVVNGFSDQVSDSQLDDSIYSTTTPWQKIIFKTYINDKGQVVQGQDGLRLIDLDRQSTRRRLAALSSHLAITDGQSAINRANISGNPLAAAQSSQMLANQSLDAGNAGLWVSLSNNTPIAGAGQGASNQMQIGQDIALSPDIIVGVAASHTALSRLAEAQSGNNFSSLNGSAIASTVYGLYSPGNLRFTVQSGVQTGSLQLYTASPDLWNESFGKSNFTGSSSELSLGYELGKDLAGKDFSLIPSFALGYRAQAAAAYREMSSQEMLALFVPEMTRKQAYGRVALELRSTIRLGAFAALPIASLGVERDQSSIRQKGDFALVNQPTYRINTKLDGHSYGTAITQRFVLDLVRSDDSAFALRTEYQGSYADHHASNILSVGLKGSF